MKEETSIKSMKFIAYFMKAAYYVVRIVNMFLD